MSMFFLIRILSLIVLIGNAIPCMEIVDLFLMQGFLCFCVSLLREVTKRVYFIGNERMLIAHDSNRLRFS